MRSVAILMLSLFASLTALAAGCRSDAGDAPPVPASSDPEGKDLVAGAIVAATEKGGGVRLYKVVSTKYFPPPMSDELLLIAYEQKGDDFQQAAQLWQKGGLTIALPEVRVQRHMFRMRDYRILGNEPVTDADRDARAVQQRQQTEAEKGS